jgi:hypothetical protein
MHSKMTLLDRLGHPMPAVYPIAFSPGPFATDLVHLRGRHPLWCAAGVIMAGVAAIRAFLDWAPGIPVDTPPTTMRQRYLLPNVVALARFPIAALTSSDQVNTQHPTVALAPLSYQGGAGVNCAPRGGVCGS